MLGFIRISLAFLLLSHFCSRFKFRILQFIYSSCFLIFLWSDRFSVFPSFQCPRKLWVLVWHFGECTIIFSHDYAGLLRFGKEYLRSKMSITHHVGGTWHPYDIPGEVSLQHWLGSVCQVSLLSNYYFFPFHVLFFGSQSLNLPTLTFK